MSQLSADRDTKTREAARERLPVAADTVIYGGAAVAADSSGNAVPAANSSGLKFRGVAEDLADNDGGDAGDVNVHVRKAPSARWAGSGFSAADLGADVYFADDQTVTKTPGGCLAGKILEVVSATSVWVDHRAVYLAQDSAVELTSGAAATTTEGATTTPGG